MPTVAIDVKTYKTMYAQLVGVYIALGSSEDLLNNPDLDNIVLPQHICDYCGYVDHELEMKEICPRCEKDLTNNQG